MFLKWMEREVRVNKLGGQEKEFPIFFKHPAVAVICQAVEENEKYGYRVAAWAEFLVSQDQFDLYPALAAYIVILFKHASSALFMAISAEARDGGLQWLDTTIGGLT